MSQKGFTYTLKLQAETQDLMNRINSTRKSMETILSSGKVPGIEKTFDSLEKSLTKLQEKASQPITTSHQFESLQKEANGVFTAFERLGNSIEALRSADFKGKMDLLPPDLKKKIEDIEKALTGFNKVQEQSKQKSEQLTQAEKNLKAAKEALLKAEEKQSTKKALVGIQEKAVEASKAEAKAILEKKNALEKFLKTQNSNKEKGLEGAASYKNTPISEIQGAQKAVPGLNLKDISAIELAIQNLTEEYNQAEKNTSKATKALQEYKDSLDKSGASAQVAKEKVDKLEKETSDLNTEFEKNKVSNIQKAYAQLRAEANRLGISLKNIPVEYSEESFEQLKLVMEQVATNAVSGLDQQLNGLQIELAETGNATDTLANKMNSAGAEVKELDDKVRNTEAFTQRIAQFVGLQGGIQIARNAMRNAINTIKELDAAMTEMAVVTDLEVGDYWNQLPQHTKRANDLGLAIKGVYEAETLYYQQGLKTNEVIEMSNETLKMARIAGLSAEDATNKMTAALRGFNMELNETSAQRISDVYSELAAITAADVDEISSAMTKTASIASSAGMEFETTAAFLSQIIETTRESAETAGTAMKTVIARFQELKKDPAEIGEIDGEIVDANKIETALRSVGVALRDTSGQFRDLDDVFLELSSKWDGLDTNTQRYIATIAAGSRQQSRFIAMMSDYNRTQELVTAANTSAGASNKQFEKTMDSLEAKLNKLKNAWDSFTLGIMDSEILKVGVDLLTSLLTAINNITDAFGDFSGAAKIGLLITALYLGDKALKVFMGSIKTGTTIFGAFGAVGKSAIGGIHKALLGIKNANKIMNAKESAQAVSAMDAYRKATEKAQKATKMQNTLMQQNNLTASKQAVIDKALAQSQDERRQAVTQYATALGLSNTQTAAAVAMSASEAGMDQICAAAVGGLTEERYKEMTAQMIAQGLSAEEIKKRQQAIISLYAEKGANDLNNKTEQMGLLLKAKAVVALLFGNKAKRQSAMESLGMATAEQIQAASTSAATGAQWSLNAAMLANPIGLIIVLIIALVAALTILVVWLIKAAKAASVEGKLKAAEEATEAAANAAEQAAEAYNNLSDAFDSLEDKYKSLEELTRGTQEWRDAIREINKEVLDLVEQYPELASLVTNEDGVLTIDFEDSRVEEILAKYESRAAAADAALLASKISVNERESDVSAKNLNKDKDLQGVYVDTGDSGYYQDLTTETLKGVSQAISNGEIIDENGSASLDDEIAAWLKENGNEFEQVNADTFAKQLDRASEKVRDFGEELDEQAVESKLYYQQMAQGAINALDKNKFSEKAFGQMDVAATAEFSEAFNQEALESIKSETKDMSKEERESWTKTEAQKIYGTDEIEVDGDGNLTVGTGESAYTVTAEEFEKQLAATKATEEMTKAFEQLPKTIGKISQQMSKEAGKAFQAMYAGKEGSAMTKADIEAASKVTEQELTQIWDSLTEQEQEAYGTLENFTNQYMSNVEASQLALQQTQEKFDAAGIEFIDSLTMESARGYAEQMRNISLLNQDAANQLNEQFNGILSTLSDSDKTKFVSQLNALDWTNVDSLESLPEVLEDIGVSVPEDELNDYIDQLIEIGGATRQIDLEKLKEASVTLTNLKGDISSGKQGRSFSEEAYKALVEMAPELAEKFQLGLDGQYTYLGSSMEDLQEAIEDNTSALLEEATKTLNNKIATAQIIEGMPITVDGNAIDFSTIAASSYTDDNVKRDVLKQIQLNARESGIEITGIQGFNNYSSVDRLVGDELTSVLQQLQEQSINLPKYLEERDKTAVSNQALLYQSNDATENAYGVDMSNGRRGQVYKTASQNQKNEFEARSNALVSQAASAGVSSTLLDEYTKIVEKYKEGAVAYSKVLKIQKELANATDYNKMKQGLANVFEEVAAIKEEYDKIADGDVKGKLSTANQLLAKFGVQAKSEDAADHYMDLVDQITKGNTQALTELVATAQRQAGLSAAAYGNAYSAGWDNLSKAQIEFLDQMEAAQLGYWEAQEDGTRKFVWATVEELQTVANMVGTLVEDWESPYDWLYNQNENINSLIREREKLERSYERALKDSTTSSAELIELSKQRLESLKEEAALQSASAQKALSNIQQLFADNREFANYVSFDATSNKIQIDEEGLKNAGFDSEDMGPAFEEFLASLEENRDVITEAEDKLEDIEDNVDEIKDQGKNETSDLYNQIKEGLIASRQKEIDALSEINSSIQEAQAKLLERIQQQIEEERQARDNERAEQDIADKESYLQYLMRDTTGANALEISSLQKEIESDKEAYQDTLIDQSLEKLQETNEYAIEQRQQQIDIMQAQLDNYAESQEIWGEVQSILDSSLGAAGSMESWQNTQAAKLINIGSGIDKLNPIERQDAWVEMYNKTKMYEVYKSLQSGGTLNKVVNETEQAVDNANTQIKDSQEKVGSLGNSNANVNTNKIVQAINGQNSGSTGNSGGTSNASSGKTSNTPSTPVTSGVSTKSTEPTGFVGTAAGKKLKQTTRTWSWDSTGDVEISTNGGYWTDGSSYNGTPYKAQHKLGTDVKNPAKTGYIYVDEQGTEYVRAVNKDGYGVFLVMADIVTDVKNKRVFENAKKYATGGLADYTGPAWLDGTKSHPELVLNARDTANFIMLKDILSEILNNNNTSGQKTKEKSGDNYYDVQINVDSLGSDYDVEQLADKIRDMIYKDSIYRNVNNVNLIR